MNLVNVSPFSSQIMDSEWLPHTNLVHSTCGTRAPSNLLIVLRKPQSIAIKWQKAVTYGRNQLKAQIVRWVELGNSDEFSRQGSKIFPLSKIQNSRKIPVEIKANAEKYLIESLIPGSVYRISVEAVVASKRYLDAEKFANEKFTICQVFLSE